MAFYIIAQNQMQHDVYSSFSASLRLCAKKSCDANYMEMLRIK
jgi:hypothetical protein